MKVSIIGQGYVGLPLAIEFAKVGVEVIGFDKNFNIVQNLQSGKSHIEDIDSKDIQELIKGGKYLPTSDPFEMNGSVAVIIAVPTPLDVNRQPDLSFVELASETIGKHVTNSSLVINESTSYPGTLRNIIAPRVRKYTNPGTEHLFSISPERVDPGNKEWKIKNTPRLYSGLNPESTEKTRQLYSLICDDLREVSSPEIAESAKLFENTFRQVNIALVNEFARITDSLNISVQEVLDAANSKPYGFMKFEPGIGVGGHCIPVDPTYLAYISEKNGIEPRFIKLANQINLETPREIIKKIEKTFAFKLENKNILICGLAYKSNISDIRESPAKILVEELSNSGSKVSIYDPHVVGYELDKLNDKNFDLGIIAVSHDNFNLDFIDKKCDKIFDVTGKFYKYPTI